MSKKNKEKENLYKVANELFIQERAKEEGAIALDNGVVYKKLQEGHGDKVPKTSSIVYVKYTGKLIDGTVIDTTEGEMLPACFIVRDLIMGWQIILTRMHEGDKVIAYIPWQYGYGKKRVDMIPGYSTLIFEMELVKFEIR